MPPINEKPYAHFTSNPPGSAKGIRNGVLLAAFLYTLGFCVIAAFMGGALNYAVEQSIIAKFEAQEAFSAAPRSITMAEAR